MMTNNFRDGISTRMAVAVFVFIVTLVSPVLSAYKKPHIIMVVADDLGWDDVSFHGSNQIPTPTLDRLAKEGVVLNNYYVSPLSTPSRAAFMTGKYASHLGLQHDDFHNQQPSGLPLSESLLPNRLRELGYTAHGVGKWHLGFFAKEYTPTFRGFDSYFGFWTDTEDYYSHVSYDNGYGLDLRRNLQLVYNESGSYSTELFTKEAKKIIKDYDNKKPMFLYLAHQAVHVGNGDDPLQVPDKYVKMFAGIKDFSRRKFAGMVATLDESLKELTEALTAKGMMQNTIIVFTTDNGGAAGGYDNSAGSNYPLRGSKNTFWEGGVRGVGFVYSPLLKNKGRICDELVHATDWLPTLYAAGGGNIQSLGKIDGYNIWDTISNSEASPRFEVLHGVDSFSELSGALRVGDYKLIVNQDDSYYGDWYPRPGVPIPKGMNKRKRRQLIEGTTIDCTIREPHPLLFTHAPVCKPRERPCLFNIKWDPCEYHNIAEIMPNTMKVMLERFYYFANASKAPIYPESDNSSRPDLHDGSWTFWRDDPHVPATNTKFVYPDPMADLKMNDHGSSSAPYFPPDNEKIFKEKAKKFANLTKHQHDDHKHHHANKTAPPVLKEPAPPVLKEPAPPPPAPKHQSYNISSPTVQKVEPNIIIEGIGNLIEPERNPITPTEQPFLAATTESSVISLQPTEPPVIDIQNVLMDNVGSGYAPVIAPTPEYMSPTKAPAKHFKPVSLGEVISGGTGKKTPAVDKNLGTKLHSHEIKIDLPQVYDVIDETDNPPAEQAPKETPNIPNVYDVIDVNKEQTKATSNHHETGSGTQTKPEQPHLVKTPPIKALPPKITPPAHTPPSPLSTFFKPKPHAPVVHPPPHKFIGDIVMDGHKFHVEGTETGDTEWLMKDFTSDDKNSLPNNQVNPALAKAKSHVSELSNKNNSPVDSTDYSEVTDVIVESPKETQRGKSKKGSERNFVKPGNAGKLLKDAAEFDSPTKNIPVTSTRLRNSDNITKQNDTNCEKPVQLESSDNAVVVSSVVIVVIASAMVVGVALVAMIAVVARHFQRAKNLNGGGAS